MTLARRQLMRNVGQRNLFDISVTPLVQVFTKLATCQLGEGHDRQ